MQAERADNLALRVGVFLKPSARAVEQVNSCIAHNRSATIFPVARPATLVRQSNDLEFLRLDLVDKAVRKPP